MNPARLVFAGTPDFAATSLTALFGHPAWRVVAVYTQPDRPAGRGRKLVASPVKQIALAHEVPVFQPEHLKDADAAKELAALDPDLMIVAAYGLLLPQAILNVPRLGCVNIHASLLPRWRGAAPIQRAILAGDDQTGITLMRMEAGLDTGPMLAKAACQILTEDHAQSLHDRLAALGAETLLATLPAVLSEDTHPESQDDSQATYAAKIERDEAVLDFTHSATDLARRVRGYFPKPIATATIDGREMRILEAEALPPGDSDVQAASSLPASKELLVGTGNGLLRIIRLQLPGKRPITGVDYVNSRRTLRA